MAHHLSPQDVVPPLRGDLAISAPPNGTGAEVITVAPIEGYGAMRMHGFEFSIARMLDGRRTAKDVIVNCQRLGLPVNIDALEDFLEQLKTHGLLGGAPTPRVGFNWKPEVRELFRDALRAAREGDFVTSKRKLDRLLEVQPGTVEAVRLESWLEHHPDPHQAGRTFGEMFQKTLDGWSAERPPHWTAEARDAVRRSMWPVLGLIIAIVALVGFSMLPTPHRVSSHASLTAAVETPVAAPEPGMLDQVLVKEGDRVIAGTPLFQYDVSELQLARAGLREQLESARSPLRAELAKTDEGAALAETLARAEAEVARAQFALLQEQKDSAGAPPNERVTRAERRFASAHAAYEVARGELDARIPLDAPGAKKAADIEDQIRLIEEQIRVQTVTAPAAGVVTKIYVKPGQPIDKGQTVMQVDDLQRMKLIATVTPKHVKNVQVGSPITVRIGEDRISTTVEAVSGSEIAAEIVNPDGALRPGVVQVQIDLPASSWVSR